MIPANVCRVSFRGHLAGNEIFDTSVWIYPETQGGSVPADDAAALALLTNVKAAFDASTLKTRLPSIWSTATGLETLAIYCYPNGGPTADASAEVADAVTGTGTSYLPDQLCLVTTLTTGKTGRSKRGRMYWPLTSTALGADGQVASSTVNNLGGGVADFIGRLAGSAGYFGAVVSQAHGYVNSITGVAADSRPDIQRRRANRQAETYKGTYAVTYA